jgi:hypothetical protein
VYTCAYCGLTAPRFDDPAILDWAGGEALYMADDPALPPESLVCPGCRGEEPEREEGAGD